MFFARAIHADPESTAVLCDSKQLTWDAVLSDGVAAVLHQCQEMLVLWVVSSKETSSSLTTDRIMYYIVM
jgi:hypothetical protein